MTIKDLVQTQVDEVRVLYAVFDGSSPLFVSTKKDIENYMAKFNIENEEIKSWRLSTNHTMYIYL